MLSSAVAVYKSLYPDAATIEKGEWQNDVGSASAIYEEYYQLKAGCYLAGRNSRFRLFCSHPAPQRARGAPAICASAADGKIHQPLRHRFRAPGGDEPGGRGISVSLPCQRLRGTAETAPPNHRAPSFLQHAVMHLAPPALNIVDVAGKRPSRARANRKATPTPAVDRHQVVAQLGDQSIKTLRPIAGRVRGDHNIGSPACPAAADSHSRSSGAESFPHHRPQDRDRQPRAKDLRWQNPGSSSVFATINVGSASPRAIPAATGRAGESRSAGFQRRVVVRAGSLRRSVGTVDSARPSQAPSLAAGSALAGYRS